MRPSTCCHSTPSLCWSSFTSSCPFCTQVAGSARESTKKLYSIKNVISSKLAWYIMR